MSVWHVWGPSVGQAPLVAKRLACFGAPRWARRLGGEANGMFWIPSVGQTPSVAKPIGLESTLRWVRRPRWQSPLGWKLPLGGSGASVAKPIFGLKYLSVGQAPSAAKPIGLQSTPRWVRCPRWQSPLGWKVGDRFTAFKALCAPALRSAAAQENTLLWLDLTQAECLLVPRRFA